MERTDATVDVELLRKETKMLTESSTILLAMVKQHKLYVWCELELSDKAKLCLRELLNG